MADDQSRPLAKWTIEAGRCGCCGRENMICAHFHVPHHAVSILGRVPLCSSCLDFAAQGVDQVLEDLDRDSDSDDEEVAP